MTDAAYKVIFGFGPMKLAGELIAVFDRETAVRIARERIRHYAFLSRPETDARLIALWAGVLALAPTLQLTLEEECRAFVRASEGPKAQALFDLERKSRPQCSISLDEPITEENQQPMSMDDDDEPPTVHDLTAEFSGGSQS